jgi:hypothetical protein
LWQTAGLVASVQPGDQPATVKELVGGLAINPNDQPAGRFWLSRAVETGIFAARALALVGSSVWSIRKRIS